MLDFLKPIKNEKFDVMYFIAGDEKDSIDIQLRQFKENEESLSGTKLGECYQILLYKHDKNGTCILPDKFEAILLDPMEYISGLIPNDWFGIIAKKTKNSHKFIDELFDKMMEV
jgi:hypothetical protein